MTTRGVRGAISVENNREEEILTATRLLLERMVAANQMDSEDIACVYFTATSDLDAVYPARAAREMGWAHVPLMCAQEMNVPASLPRCIRVLILWNTHLPQGQVKHIYLGEATRLRPDLVEQ
ncbi:MAG: chorismate mutase [Anaerolineae bacterium]|nr:chorismate mutase [Anaerolineae bacterium]